ncbi:Negative regulator of mitotic exit [Ceratobasidium sp. 423]|nr:Negative regulator of mitotic exit [Ceratobasidium sp. 423]
MASFFSRKRHTAQPAATPQPPPQPQPQPQQTQNQGSVGRAQAPPQRPQPPPQQQQQQTPDAAQTPQSANSQRPRQDYPWSVRLLRIEAPLRIPGGNGPSVTSMSGPPLPRYGHSVPLVATPGGDIFVFGGLVKDQVKDDLWMLRGVWGPEASQRRTTKEMSVVASLLETTGDAPGPRVGHKSALVSSVLIVWGGDTLAKEGERNDDGLYLLNLTTRDWTRVAIVGPAPVGRYGHAVGMCGNKFIVFGGQVDGEFLNDLWSFDLQSLVRGTSAWEQLVPAPGNEPPPKRTGHVLVTYENKIYIFGGTDGAFHYNDTWCFDMQTKTWTELTCIGFIPVPREGHAAALVGDVMYVFGGRGVDGKDLGDLGSFKISNHRWYMFQNMGPQPSGRSGHAMATNDGRMFVIGGESGEVGPTKDDAMMVHVLDTNLIKYPESRPGAGPQNRRPNGGVTSPPPGQGPSSSQGHGQVLTSQAPLNSQAGQLPAPQRGLGLGLERGSSGTPEGARATPDGIRGTPDVQHTRNPPELAQQARNPSEVQHARNSSEVAQHARTPAELTPDRTRSPPGTRSPINMAAVAMRTQASGSGSRSGSPADLKPTINGHTRAASALSARGSPLVGSAQEELEVLRRKDAWMRAALARAAAAGFVWTEQDQDGLGEWSAEDAPNRLADVVVGLRQQQAKLQSSFVAQLQSASDKLNEADRIKTAALQEAAFCRAKLAAYESTLDNDPAKLEREKSANLERLVAAAQTERAVLERTLVERTDALALQTQLREQAEERAADAIRRAEIAEEDQARTEAEHHETTERNVFLEGASRDQLEKMVVVQSSLKQHEAEHAAVLQKLEETSALRDQHMRALEQTQQALAATTARADDMERQWERSTGMIQSLEEDVARLRVDLEERTQESQRATERLRDVEEAWAKSREEADAHRHATTSSLGMLLDSHKEMMADEDRASRGHAEKVHAMEMEISSLRKMLTEAGNRITANQSDLVAHQRKTGTAMADAAALRAQLGGLRAQLASQVAEQGRLKQEIAMKETAVRERASAASSAEVRLGMLRKYLVDNGVVVDEEDINADSDSRGGMVRVQQLENELRERTRLYQDLERELQDANRRREDAEARIQHLIQQLERAKSAASPSSPDAEGRVVSAERKREETETRLNKRIQELGHDYEMAVKYVKGTEKLMRRMKEDYAKSKALNEKLQADLDSLRGITSSEAGARTRGATGRNTPLSDEGHDPVRAQLVESQRSLQRLTADRNDLKRQLEALQRDLEQSREDLVISQNEASEREIQIEELEAKIEHLERSLSLARNGSDETVVERLTNENAALRREKDLLSHKVHILLDDQGGYAEDRPVSGISHRESQASTENGMTQFDSFEDWQQRINSRASTTRESDYEPSSSHLPHERNRSGA